LKNGLPFWEKYDTCQNYRHLIKKNIYDIFFTLNVSRKDLLFLVAIIDFKLLQKKIKVFFAILHLPVFLCNLYIYVIYFNKIPSKCLPHLKYWHGMLYD